MEIDAPVRRLTAGPSRARLTKSQLANRRSRSRSNAWFKASPIPDVLAPFRNNPAITKLREYICDGPSYNDGTKAEFAAAVEACRSAFVGFSFLFLFICLTYFCFSRKLIL